MDEIQPTAEDWERAKQFMERDPREAFLETVARMEARRRVEREQRERRRARLRRLTLGLLGR